MKTLLVKYCLDHIRVAILVKTLLVKYYLDHIRVAILVKTLLVNIALIIYVLQY